jgi:hypothetical protein
VAPPPAGAAPARQPRRENREPHPERAERPRREYRDEHRPERRAEPNHGRHHERDDGNSPKGLGDHVPAFLARR